MITRKLIPNRIAKLRLPLLCLQTDNIRLAVKLLALLTLPVLSFSQSSDRQPKSIADTQPSAINWTRGLTWKQIKQNAKKENKYIFVDCFTTWCKPCREMDMKVYTVDSVGEFLNKGFISVKVQMDQTKNDDAETQSWYKTVSSFSKEYNLNAYPTLLFFTPAGEVATKEVGYKDAATLITSAKNAKDRSKQYYVLLQHYKKGKLDDAAKRSLINMANQLNDTATYQALRTSYFAYLHSLPKEKLYTKENIEFIASIISRRKQVVMDMFYPDGTAVDRVMEKSGYARKVVDDVIMKETLAAVLNAGTDTKLEPDWTALYNTIAKDYNNEYADRNVLEAKIQWYGRVEPDIVKFSHSLNDKMEKYGTDTTDRGKEFLLNNLANFIFEGLGQTAVPDQQTVSELTRITKWMEGVVRRGATATGFRLEQWHLYIDTYANILYKIGRTDEAIKYEEMAIAKCKEIGGDWSANVSEYEQRLNKMRKNEPTWPIASN